MAVFVLAMARRKVPRLGLIQSARFCQIKQEVILEKSGLSAKANWQKLKNVLKNKFGHFHNQKSQSHFGNSLSGSTGWRWRSRVTDNPIIDYIWGKSSSSQWTSNYNHMFSGTYFEQNSWAYFRTCLCVTPVARYWVVFCKAPQKRITRISS